MDRSTILALLLLPLIGGCIDNDVDLESRREECRPTSDLSSDDAGVQERFDFLHCSDTLYLKLSPDESHRLFPNVYAFGTERIPDLPDAVRISLGTRSEGRSMVLRERYLPTISLFIHDLSIGGPGDPEYIPWDDYEAELIHDSIREVQHRIYKGVETFDTVWTPLQFDSALGIYYTRKELFVGWELIREDEGMRREAINGFQPILELRKKTYLFWKGEWYSFNPFNKIKVWYRMR